jgi:hypothetical protein
MALDTKIENGAKGEVTPISQSEEVVLSISDLNARFIQMVSYFIEWAKHIITISSGVLVLSVAFLKDVVSGAEHIERCVLVLLLIAAYLCLLGSINRALKYMSTAAASVLTTDLHLVRPDVLAELKNKLSWTQRLFFLGLSFFVLFSMVSLLTWTFDK